MTERYASGNWHVTAGKEDEFIERWTEFLRWTRKVEPGLISARLIRDERDPKHFVSMADWEDEDARNRWRAQAEFGPHFDAVRELCDEMYGSDYVAAVTV